MYCVARASLFQARILLALLLAGSVAADLKAQARIVGPLVEGRTALAGVTDPSLIGATVRLIDSPSGNLIPLQNGATSATTDSSGAFTLNLAYPLYAGQGLTINVSKAASPPDPAVDATTPPMPVAALADWGRVRAYFAAGTVLSHASDFKNQSDLFLGFNVDKNWRWAGVPDFWTPTLPTSATPKLTKRWAVNTFFETRLTSVPESQTSTPATTTTTATTDQLASFIGSRKSALMQVGLYFPVYLDPWAFQGAPNALFIAPISKVGFITPTGPAESQTAGGSQASPLNPSRFYHYYEFGARFGHSKLHKDPNNAPELISYLDVMWGRFSNLETLAPITNATGVILKNANGDPLTYSQRRWRLGIEGLLKVPQTPFVVGFSANIGQNLLLQRQVQAAKDDLRFFFGTRFDVGKLMGQLGAFR